MNRSMAMCVALAEHVWNNAFAGGAHQRDAALQSLESTAGIDLGTALRLTMLGEWWGLGMPRVVVSHRLAASFVFTSIAPVDVPDVIAPWSVFMLDVPTRMARDGAGREVASLIAFDLQEGDLRTVGGFVVPENPDHPCSELRVADSVTQLTAQQTESESWRTALSRFLAGTIAELGDHRAACEAARGTVKRDGRGAPQTRTMVLSRAVAVDCREAVSQALGGAEPTRRQGHSQSVQSLVRGHWKRQACGAGLSERRWKHIEPYWRGPDDAPIAVRPHIMKDQ